MNSKLLMASLDKFNFASALLCASLAFPAFPVFMRINAVFTEQEHSLGLTEQAQPAASPRSLARSVVVSRIINHSCAENSRGLSRTFYIPCSTVLPSVPWYTLGHHLPVHLPAHSDDSHLLGCYTPISLPFSMFSMCAKMENAQRTESYLGEIQQTFLPATISRQRKRVLRNCEV